MASHMSVLLIIGMPFSTSIFHSGGVPVGLTAVLRCIEKALILQYLWPLTASSIRPKQSRTAAMCCPMSCTAACFLLTLPF